MSNWRFLRSIAAVAGSFCFAGAQAGYVVCHPSVDLNIDDVRLVFLGEKQFAAGVKLTPVDNLQVRAQFLEKILQTDERKYEARWLRKGFREGFSAPQVKGSDAEALTFIRSTNGAVGYIEKLSPGVRVLESF